MSATVTKLRRPAESTLTARTIRRFIEDGEQHLMPDALVTPEIAAVLLEYNRPGETNRNVSKSFISATAAAMKAGRWENTGEPVIVSDAKLLNDGQHRLMAVIEAGVSVTMDIRFGIARHAFAATNAGRKRSGAQALQIMGVKGTSLVAAMARFVLLYERGLPRHQRDYVSNSDIIQAVERWPDLAESVRFTWSMSNTVLKQRAVATLGFFAQRVANESNVREFFHVINTGEGSADNPPHMLRELLLKRGPSKNVERSFQSLAYCIIAWNAWRRPDADCVLKWRETQPFPVVEGLRL
jgi:hypothetical protein